MANRNPPGYISEAEKKLQGVAFRLQPETVSELDAVAAAAGLTKRQVVAEAIHEYAAKRGCASRARGPHAKAVLD